MRSQKSARSDGTGSRPAMPATDGVGVGLPAFQPRCEEGAGGPVERAGPSRGITSLWVSDESGVQNEDLSADVKRLGVNNLLHHTVLHTQHTHTYTHSFSLLTEPFDSPPPRVLHYASDSCCRHPAR